MKNVLTVAGLLLAFLNLNSQTWSSFGAGVNNDIHDFYVLDSSLIAAGRFTSMDGKAADGMAVWRWSPFTHQWEWDEEVEVGWVYDLEKYNGELYAAGDFGYLYGTTPAGCLAKRSSNGSWSKVGNGGIGGYNFYASVHALAVYNNTLYAAGSFTSLGGTAARNIAAWDGISWVTVGNGIQSSLYDGVREMCTYGGELFAAGQFSMAGTVPLNNVAKWNGSAWSAVADFGVEQFGYATVNAFAEHGVYLLAGGNFTTVNGAPTKGIARFDGVSWTDASAGIGTSKITVSRMAEVYGTLYASGTINTSFVILKWDDSSESWINIGNSTGEPVQAMIGYDGRLVVGGFFQSINTVQCNGIAKYALPNPAGFDEHTTGKIAAGPNPFSTVLHISSELRLQRSTVSLRNCLGECVYSRAVTEENGVTIARGDLAAGVYMLSITRNGVKAESRTIVVQD